MNEPISFILFLFYLIVLYGVSFSQFCTKGCEKFPIQVVGSCSQMLRKNPAKHKKYPAGLSHPFLGIGPGPTELGNLAAL